VVRIEGAVGGTGRGGREVRVGKGGEVEGDVISREAIIGGEVRGSIRADERIEITSPSTSPPFPTSTCRPARTVPTTMPSIFTTPSAVMSPTTRIPVPMMDSPASESSGPCPFSVNIAISVLLFHDREGIERLALAADF